MRRNTGETRLDIDSWIDVSSISETIIYAGDPEEDDYDRIEIRVREDGCSSGNSAELITKGLSTNDNIRMRYNLDFSVRAGVPFVAELRYPTSALEAASSSNDVRDALNNTF